MSEEKKGGRGKIVKAITKPVRMPVDWAVPRSVIRGTKEFKFENSRYPICPNCSLARFSKLENKNSEGKVVWQCSSCDFEALTKGGDIEDISLWCEQNAQEVYNNSKYQQKRLEEYAENPKDGFIALNVRRNMFGCYIFLGLASLFGLAFLYACWTTKIFFIINTLFFVIATLFMAIIFNYRAWQAITNSLYSPNAKQQFHWWVRNHPWFRYPEDIGKPKFHNDLPDYDDPDN